MHLLGTIFSCGLIHFCAQALDTHTQYLDEVNIGFGLHVICCQKQFVISPELFFNTAVECELAYS